MAEVSEVSRGSGGRDMALSITAPPNNGMHPTADTTALIYINHAGRRVMPALDAFALYVKMRPWRRENEVLKDFN
jgi:hypothetical protein